MTDNTVINGLWVGKRLSNLELLTLHSFVRHGHTFHLWIYEQLENTLPDGIICKDANEIIPQSEIFYKQKGDKTKNFGVGSLALFSDLFRYKLLYEKGGWWVDMDVTCLASFSIKTPYFFRSHPILPMVGNVMKCPKHAPVMLATYQITRQQCDEQTTDWLLSNQLLSEQVKKHGLDRFISKKISNDDDWLIIERLLFGRFQPPQNWNYIHWMNEEWRQRGIDKNIPLKKSFLQELYQQYQLTTEVITVSIKHRILYKLKECKRSLLALLEKRLNQ